MPADATGRSADVERLLAGDAERDDIARASYDGWRAPCRSACGRAGQAWGEPPADLRPAAAALRQGDWCCCSPTAAPAGDRKAGYHDTSSPPRHAYVAFYAWLRERRRSTR